MSILVTGATGHLGALAIDALLARGIAPDHIVAGARDTAKISQPAGVRTVTLDYDDPATVAAAFDDVDAVLLVSGSEVGRRVPQHQAVIDAARHAGVRQLVYTSAPFATTSGLILAPEHKATEEAIAASGLPATILRNSWYNENYLPKLAEVAQTGVLVGSAKDGKVASAARKDFAEAVAVVLTTDGHLGRTYELAGDSAWDYAGLAAVLGDVLDREVVYRDVSTQEHQRILTEAGLPQEAIGFVTGLDANIAEGDLAFTDGTLRQLIGHPTTPLIETLRG